MLYRFTLPLMLGGVLCCCFSTTTEAQVPQPDHIGVTVKKTEGGKGLQVVNVTGKSLGAQLKLTQGDYIFTVNDQPVGSQMDLVRALSQQNKKLSVSIKRGTVNQLITADVYWPAQGFKAADKGKKGDYSFTDREALPPLVIKVDYK